MGSSPGLNVGLGYVSSNRFVLGVRTQLSTTSHSSGAAAGDSSATSIVIFPRIELLFDGEDARPFIAVMVGVGSVSSTTHLLGGGKDQASTTQYAAGASAGVHVFMTEDVSLDPMLTLSGFAGSMSATHTAGSTLLVPGDKDSSGTLSASGKSIMFTLGLSAWLGGHRQLPLDVPAGTETVENTVAANQLDDDADAAPDATPPGGTDSNWVEINLPDHHGLYLQKTKHPERTSVSVRVTESGSQWELVGCGQVSVAGSGSLKEKARVENGELHSVSGHMPVAALEALASSEAPLNVCAKQWPLSAKSRAAIQAFLVERKGGKPEADEDMGEKPAPDTAKPSALPAATP